MDMTYKATYQLVVELVNAETMDNAQIRAAFQKTLLEKHHQVIEVKLVNVFEEKRVSGTTRILTKTRTRTGDKSDG